MEVMAASVWELGVMVRTVPLGEAEQWGGVSGQGRHGGQRRETLGGGGGVT